MSIKELEEIRKIFFTCTSKLKKYDETGLIDCFVIDWFMEEVINTFKEYENKQEEIRKQSDDNWRTLEYHTDYLISNDRKIKILDKRVKKLRKQYNEGKGKEIKVGGTD